MPLKKAEDVWKEFKAGTLNSGSKHGPIVTNPKQATAIFLSEKRRLAGKKPKIGAQRKGIAAAKP